MSPVRACIQMAGPPKERPFLPCKHWLVVCAYLREILEYLPAGHTYINRKKNKNERQQNTRKLQEILLRSQPCEVVQNGHSPPECFCARSFPLTKAGSRQQAFVAAQVMDQVWKYAFSVLQRPCSFFITRTISTANISALRLPALRMDAAAYCWVQQAQEHKQSVATKLLATGRIVPLPLSAMKAGLGNTRVLIYQVLTFQYLIHFISLGPVCKCCGNGANQCLYSTACRQ